jgi:hypothetical protein
MTDTVDRLIDAVAQELADAGLCRLPDVEGVGARPWPAPFWREPDAAPAPGDKNGTEGDDGIVVSCFQMPGVPPRAYEGMVRNVILELWIRGQRPPQVMQFETAIRGVLIDRYGVQMGTGDPAVSTRVLACRVVREPQRPQPTPGKGFTWTVSYGLDIYHDG